MGNWLLAAPGSPAAPPAASPARDTEPPPRASTVRTLVNTRPGAETERGLERERDRGREGEREERTLPERRTKTAREKTADSKSGSWTDPVNADRAGVVTREELL